MQQREVAVVPPQAQVAEELPRLLPIPRRPGRRAVERAVVLHLAAPVRRVDRPVAEVAVADLEILGLPIFPTPQAGLEELLLAWQCEVDKARWLPAGRCLPGTGNPRPLQPFRPHRRRPNLWTSGSEE